jgi:hypothetical protein
VIFQISVTILQQLAVTFFGYLFVRQQRVRNKGNLELRQEALDTLRESTELFKRAVGLLKAGREKEVERVCEMARAKRFHSALLMRKAKLLDNQH